LKGRTKKKVTEPERWDQPQLDTPIGRVELWLGGNPDHVTVHRAGWLELYEKYADRSVFPPHLDERARRQTDLTPHIDTLGLTRAADGSWKPARTYRARRDREVAQAIADAVTAWMKVDAPAKADLRRRGAAVFHGLSPRWWGPGAACEALADSLSADIKAGRFDFDDVGHARAVAAKMTDRLRQMMDEVDAMRSELRQTIASRTDDQAAA
jgi:hypothetical protein